LPRFESVIRWPRGNGKYDIQKSLPFIICLLWITLASHTWLQSPEGQYHRCSDYEEGRSPTAPPRKVARQRGAEASSSRRPYSEDEVSLEQAFWAKFVVLDYKNPHHSKCV